MKSTGFSTRSNSSTGLSGKNIENVGRDICSEFVRRGFQNCVYSRTQNLPPGNVIY